ncbi:MAG: M20/M25/M40 family metallo-hydrolase, partial [Acidobacteria bacterium]
MWQKPLIHRHKTLARLALYLGAALLPLLVWRLIHVLAVPIYVPGAGWYRPVEEFEAMEPVRLFQEYLRIDTSPDGSEIAGAEYLAQQLAAAGIEAHVERLGDHHANLWAIVEGEDPKALVLHNHIDVDPIEHPERWEHPPFGAEIVPPWIYGRGAFDMKSVAIAQLMAVLELKRSGIALRRSLIFLATGDEERGSRMGTRWLLRQHPELTARFGAVLTEGGVVEALDPATVKYWGTEIGQKRFIDVTACHPRRDRLEALREDVLAADKASFKRYLTPELKAYFREYGPTRDLPELRRLLRRPERLLEGPELTELPYYLQLTLRNDVAPRRVSEDAGGGYSLPILLALVPGIGLDEALPELLPAWMTHGVDLAFDEPPPPPPPR